MSESSSDKHVPRNAASWAQPVDRMEAGELPAGALNLNVTGRRPLSPLQGFGQLWQKTYQIRLAEGETELTPEQIIQEWKANFSKFWPQGNQIFGSLTGVEPGDVAVINAKVPGGLLVSTGIRVIYADGNSFTFMTPEGHVFAGMITFSALREKEANVAQIQALIRTNDPIFEMSFRLGFGHKAEDEIWHKTLTNLATHLGTTGVLSQRNVLVDKKVQWREAKNIFKNSVIRSTIYMPIHLGRRLFRKK